jgi:hypothetical protein
MPLPTIVASERFVEAAARLQLDGATFRELTALRGAAHGLGEALAEALEVVL